MSNQDTDRDEERSETHVPAGSDYVSDRDFVDFPISAEVLKGIQELGYRTATPVQASAIEPALAGRSMIVRAKTGTGKTAAFCIPIIEQVEDGERTTRSIILAPTRELAQQIAEEASALARYRDLNLAVLVGGLPMGPQERALEAGAAIVVGTPGRVLDHMRRRNLDLSGVKVACLDEADEMVSMGFYEDVTNILDACPKGVQVLLFSATISPQTERIVKRYLEGAEQVLLSTDADQVEGISHLLYETPPGQHKVRSLLFLLDLEDPSSAIIFCNTREDTATVASFLDRQGLDVQLLSGELPQSRRSRVMKQVKRGEVRFLVATDVAARGIDISDLSHVINYSLPQDPAVYLHRTGRTGRIGKKGTAISLVGGPDISTRKVLETQHGIQFDQRDFPEPEACVARRVERQAAQIRDAMGTMVFEAYLPTVRALREREDGDALLAASLRAFFQWDRTRRARIAAEAEGEDYEARLEAEGDRGERPRREPRARADKPREKGRKRRDDDKGRRRDDDRGKRRERDDDRGKRKRSRAETDTALDDLLVVGSEPEGDDKKKRKRRRKKKKSEDGQVEGAIEAALVAEDEAPKARTDLDDLDALLSD